MIASNFETLEKIDTKLDELDVLISKLRIPETNVYRQKIYDLYAALETAVEKNF